MINITGLRMKNPTILAAGIMGTTGAALIRMAHEDAGAVVTKSIGPQPKDGHSNPSMVKLDHGYLNAMGLPNPSYESFLPELEKAKCKAEVPVIASIFGGNADEFRRVAEGLIPGKPDAFELNVSCPHAMGYGASVGTDPVMVKAVTSGVCEIADVPVWVKLTPNVTDIVTIGKAAQEGGADAVVAINTVRGMAIDIHSGYPVLGNRFGGLSGEGIRPIAVKCVYDLHENLDIPIIGVGGISTWQHAIEMIMAGASAVQIGSAVYGGTNVFSDISEGINRFLKEYSYTNLKDITGIAHERF
ncbi:dihydroorotate dehydrogenase [uncultured Methanomethylovorans sp.]|uniref:dihydroorotate dehydrogenase n=1 Tax=uncultured Methanomethylovorans sp. TaxID=183759 RepID=UPI002AA768BE|nr:dihydroorotate dehydrogenase [uncultured Methanomethylovorans sp.]